MLRRLTLLAMLVMLPRPALAAEAMDGEQLDLEALLSPQVEVATKRRQALSEAPAVIEVLTAEDMRVRGYQSVAEALRAVPGFYVADDHFLPSVGVRGIPSGQRAWSRIVKVMIDGNPVSFRPDASNFLGPELIPVELIKRIEIVRGPGSALYGADAFLGVINVVTLSGEDLAGRHLTTQAGNFGRNPQALASLALGEPLPWGNAELALGGMMGVTERSGMGLAATSPAISTLSSLQTANDRSLPRTLFGRLGRLGTPVGEVSLDGGYQRVDASGEFQDWRPFTHQSRLGLENRFGRATLRGGLGEAVDTTLSMGYAQGNPTPEDRLGIGRDDYLIRRDMASEAWDAAAEAMVSLNARDSLTLGADWSQTDHQLPTYYDVFTPASPRAGTEIQDGPAGISRHFTNLGLYSQGIVHLGQSLGVTLGLRSDSHSIYGNVLNSRLGLVSPLAEGVTGKILYGTSFKAPSPQQLFGRPLVFGDIIGNEALRPERAQTVEAAVNYQPVHGWDLVASTYYTHVTDKVGFVTQRGNPKAINQNQLDSVGVEGGLKWTHRGLFGMLNLSAQQTVSQALALDEISDSEGLAEAYPALMANAGLGVPLGDFTAYLEARHVGGVPATQSNFANNGHVAYTLPAATICDLTLSSREWSLAQGSLRGSLKLYNLFDAPSATPGFGGVDYPGPGRMVLLRMQYGW